MDKARSWKFITGRSSKNKFGVEVVKGHGMILCLQKIIENFKNISVQYGGAISWEDFDSPFRRLEWEKAMH